MNIASNHLHLFDLGFPPLSTASFFTTSSIALTRRVSMLASLCFSAYRSRSCIPSYISFNKYMQQLYVLQCPNLHTFLAAIHIIMLLYHYTVSGDNNQFSAMELSQDHTSWTEYAVNNSNYLVQPSVIRPTPSKSFLQAFFRDRRAEHIYSATSSDEGTSRYIIVCLLLPSFLQCHNMAHKHRLY